MITPIVISLIFMSFNNFNMSFLEISLRMRNFASHTILILESVVVRTASGLDFVPSSLISVELVSRVSQMSLP
jgi:hypothetical protein